jgi:nitroreductase
MERVKNEGGLGCLWAGIWEFGHPQEVFLIQNFLFHRCYILFLIWTSLIVAGAQRYWDVVVVQK